MKHRDYAYGFHDTVKPVYFCGSGLSEAVIRNMSAIKEEPQ